MAASSATASASAAASSRMVSDQEICRCVESLLRHSPPGAVTSVGSVVRHLESSLGLDLSHKASFIRDHIHLLLSPHHQQHQPQPPPLPSPPPQQQQQQKDHFALGPQFHPFQNYPHPQHQHQHHLQQQQQQGPVTPQFCYRHPQPPSPAPQMFQFQHQQQQPVASSPGVLRPVAVVASPKESSPAVVKRKGGTGGLSKVCGVSPELQTIVGEPTMARTMIVKQLWAYIRKNNLQDPANKRKIICNDELRLLFQTDSTDMFQMNKLLAKHILPLEPRKDSGPDSKRLKTTTAPAPAPAPAPDVSPATNPDAIQSPVLVSVALADFFGTGEREMLESEALRRVWDYIKANTLQDPVNTMVIACDAKLQQLFGCEKVSALGISEMLSRHLKRS
ncbi:uncharacterized protein M6B38_289035 [Iris pallida]|uniref:DM2 domain-containing protein n=1 Tax=Iris pallida TaxID=29817 RepID=A0AAX6HXF9_IRIPA|nr:uncharacterized protein M6B38_289035 [Iris pallida]